VRQEVTKRRRADEGIGTFRKMVGHTVIKPAMVFLHQ
jgi:hypothetical protein